MSNSVVPGNNKPALQSDIPAWKKNLIAKNGNQSENGNNPHYSISSPAAKARNSVCLAIDCSGSMGENNKLLYAKKGALGFAKKAMDLGYTVGLVSFWGEAKSVLTPIDDINVIESAIMSLQIGDSTNISAAIEVAALQLRETIFQQVICLVTDGMPIMPDSIESAIKAANVVKSRGIEIITMGTEDADREFLAKIASTTALSSKVEVKALASGIEKMALLLPDTKSRLH